ncbi:hypothetical protein [Massilia sp. TWP1-3-3]|uniref:hypothetical protein n=1 Tax=Massilia sp. TWP1-3-3 TaxID=2804573 RepID=UPI003CF61A29
MTPREAFEEIEKRIPTGTALTDALKEFVNFYSATSIEGCPKDSEGDMLLFEWGGPYPWDECVSLNLTRQFSLHDENGDYDRMQQLHMHCRYDASQVSLVAGNEWLHGQDVDAFLEHVLNAPCTQTVKMLSMHSLAFDLHDV